MDEQRKEVLRFKLVTGVAKITNLAEGRVEAIASTEAVDRDGDIIRVAGWDLKDFKAHPVLLSSHNYRSLTSVIGLWEKMEVKGKRLIGTAKFFLDDGNVEAEAGFKLIEKGLGAFSVGFKPDWSKVVELDPDKFMGGLEFNGQQLLEVSQVTIPSNPEALQRMKGLLPPVLEEMLANANETPTMPTPEEVEGLRGVSQEEYELLYAKCAGFERNLEGMRGRLREALKQLTSERIKRIIQEVLR